MTNLKRILMKKLYLLLFTLVMMLIFSGQMVGQNVLVVRDYVHKKTVLFTPGSEIEFLCMNKYGEKERIMGTIKSIDEDIMTLMYFGEYDIDDIETIYVLRKWLRRSQEVAFLAGAGFLALTGVNNLISKNNYSVSLAGYVTSSSLIVASAITLPFSKKKFHLRDKDKFNWEVIRTKD